MKFIIVTGMSGSGKTVTLKLLEDYGYYCADNLPVELIGKFVELLESSSIGNIGAAIGIDIRSSKILSGRCRPSPLGGPDKGAVCQMHELSLTLGYIYTRNANPTVSVFEEKVRVLEGADAALALASGMGAIANSLYTFLRPGDRVVSVKDTMVELHPFSSMIYPRYIWQAAPQF